ncbi:MAG: hypothetical protein R3344_02665, partial [Acidobacteriota bacterium]|nr:hypothetical protein [Acidobacteriota bacterium]
GRFPEAGPPSPDPRVGLGAGVFDAEEAIWNLRWVSQTPPPESFVGKTNSDLAFLGNYAIQGNYDGVIVWDISNPARPTLAVEYVCPASQSDVSVYGNLLFVSGEGTSGRLDCGDQGIEEAVSHHRLRGIRIFDISDIRNPEYIANVQTCRGSHTHSVLKHPGDDDNVYIYVSGSSFVRPEEELEGCIAAGDDPASALFRIEVIRVPLDSPTEAAIVSSPRIFQDLVAPPTHGMSPADVRMIEEARERGEFVAEIQGQAMILPPQFTEPQLQRIVNERGGTGAPTAADSAQLREEIPGIIEAMIAAQGGGDDEDEDPDAPRPGPTQCHDITLYPAIGLAGGACGGYGLLLDISDPENPVRIDAVSDSNFSYWHSATFNNDGTKILFTDEWGGGGGPKCREGDPYEWGADAVFTIENRRMVFHEYFKLPAVQTSEENCVAHNGSLIPIPGRDVMVQGWYQGGINVFDFTDPDNPIEIAYHDRGPINAEQMQMAGSWSVYWYNGVIVNSEIARGLDIFELTPSAYLTQNEIDAAKSVRLDYLNAQGQPQYVWPPSFALSGAYLDQLARRGMRANRVASTREALRSARAMSGDGRASALRDLAGQLDGWAAGSADPDRMRKLAQSLRDLAAAG